MRIKPRCCECSPQLIRIMLVFFKRFDEIYGPIRYLGVKLYRHIKSRRSLDKRKGEEKSSSTPLSSYCD